MKEKQVQAGREDEDLRSFGACAFIYQSTRRNIPKDVNLQQHHL
jgi:hypothetical protein